MSRNQDERKKAEQEQEAAENEKMEEYGQMTLENNERKKKIHLLSIIGEVEGHENLSGNAKATKYDHVLPQLAALEDDDSVDGLLVLLNTSGGPCYRGDDRVLKYAHGIPGAGRKSFHRRSSGSVHGLFLHRTHRHHDGSPGPYERHGDRGFPDLRIF